MPKSPAKRKPKLTKAERRAKYTRLARDRQIKERHKQTVCFHCRQRGHAVAQCPQNTIKQQSANSICFKCGSTQHSVWKCPQLVVDNDDKNNDLHLPYATCFVCHETGHLASACPQNPHGVYVRGTGACQICGSKRHLKSDCPKQSQQSKERQDHHHDKYLPKDNFEDLLASNHHQDLTTCAKTDKKDMDTDPSSETNSIFSAQRGRPKKRRTVNF